jgi:hypothetical protein
MVILMIDHVRMSSPVYEYKSASCVPYESMSHVSSCFSWWMKYIKRNEYIASQMMAIFECIYVIRWSPKRVYTLTYSYLHALASSLYHKVLIPYRILLNLFEVDLDVQSIDLIVRLKQKEKHWRKERNNPAIAKSWFNESIHKREKLLFLFSFA